MAYLYLDDSKHHPHGFSLAAFAICDADPHEELEALFVECGFDLSSYEYKSSTAMRDNPGLQRLRNALRGFVSSKCQIAVCIVDGDKQIGPASLALLKKAILHPKLRGQRHQVFFDEGLFSSESRAKTIASEISGLDDCTIHFEQDSQRVSGIQVADLIAHTCGTMLLDALGKINKIVNVPNSGYDDGVEIDLGFEMWAGIRYSFLSVGSGADIDDEDFAVVLVEPHGLYIDPSASPEVSVAAPKRFGSMYLGCIH
ncbi:hypothetical protein SAMN04488077_103106 [Roseovarius tolerans]|uniref:DUF3800 domain-containing protein n=1 Tax=Roseovarius tolerans TaxID=74031 RepID=A0A1H7WQS3_9RHOB|nr:DUF3800 domain-containing protein [Roseovarius tolerans]SEM23852.1 hypothetical protein SAMN04488077_103106 [Roseovarius tolerans]